MEQLLAIRVSVPQARSWGAPVPGMRGGTPPFRGQEGCSVGAEQKTKGRGKDHRFLFLTLVIHSLQRGGQNKGPAKAGPVQINSAA
jgi:hypothetical protein